MSDSRDDDRDESSHHDARGVRTRDVALFGLAMLVACGSDGASTTGGGSDAAVDASTIVDAPDIDAALVDAARGLDSFIAHPTS